MGTNWLQITTWVPALPFHTSLYTCISTCCADLLLILQSWKLWNGHQRCTLGGRGGGVGGGTNANLREESDHLSLPKQGSTKDNLHVADHKWWLHLTESIVECISEFFYTLWMVVKMAEWWLELTTPDQCGHVQWNVRTILNMISIVYIMRNNKRKSMRCHTVIHFGRREKSVYQYMVGQVNFVSQRGS